MNSVLSLTGVDILSGHFAGMVAMVAVAALLQGVGGLGFAMFSAPISALVFPELAPGPLLVLGGMLAVMMVLRERSAIDLSSAGMMATGRIGGNFIAVAVLASLGLQSFYLVFAALILLGVGLSYSGWRIEPRWYNLVTAGIVSGVMGTITSSGAPPYAIVMQHTRPDRLRATLNTVFAFGAITSLALLASIGRFTTRELWLGLLLFPALYAGFWISGWIAPHVPRGAIRHFLLGLSAVSALALLARAAVM